jgi:hypothetical protein
MDIGTMLVLLGIVFVAFVAFNLYVLWCHLDFVLNATRLYRQMVRRQDATLQLLLDIRDNTKKVDPASLAPDESPVASPAEATSSMEQFTTCIACGAKVYATAGTCDVCGRKLPTA